MKKLLFATVVGSVTLAGCQPKQADNAEQNAALADASHAQLTEAIADRDSLLSFVNDISAGMEQIKQLENILTLTNGMNGETVDQRAKIKADIMSIQRSLEERRLKLEELEKKLASSTLNNSKLNKTIETLRAQIDSQSAEIETLKRNLAEANDRIGALNTTVDSLNTTVANVTASKDSVQRETVELANELNTCYYVIASKSELKAHKIIETGFLRKTKLMKGDFDQSFFTTADKRRLTYIALHSKKAEVLSNQPADSYEIVDENGQKILKILNPDSFWSLSNYLVVKID